MTYELRSKRTLSISLAPNFMASNDSNCDSPTSMATFSSEQFLQILSAISSGKKWILYAVHIPFPRTTGSCSSGRIYYRYNGLQRHRKISDADALRGMPLLLEDYAATWWAGVKDSLQTFAAATELIRTTFSPPTPDWKIFLNIFEQKQHAREATDSFICKKRLLFSQLMVTTSEAIQLNMIYGLLSIKIRERVRRDSF